MGKAIADKGFEADCTAGADKPDNPLRTVGEIVRQFDQAATQCEQCVRIIPGVIKGCALGNCHVFDWQMNQFEIGIGQVVEKRKLPNAALATTQHVGHG